MPRWAFVSLRDLYITFGLVATLSSALAIAQAVFGWYPFPVWQVGQAPGLFFNPTHASQTAAIVIVSLVVTKVYWLIPGAIPGLYLAHSRGGWLALAIGLIATRLRQPIWFVVVALAFGVIFTYHPNSSDTQRLAIWHAAWINLTFWGNGFGSFQALYMGDPTCCVVHPEYVHNDYLQTVFEFGVWSVIPFGIVGYAVSRTSAKAWPILICFLFMAGFSMPLHMPVVAAVGALALSSILLEARNA